MSCNNNFSIGAAAPKSAQAKVCLKASEITSHPSYSSIQLGIQCTAKTNQEIVALVLDYIVSTNQLPTLDQTTNWFTEQSAASISTDLVHAWNECGFVPQKK